jgi:fluoroacetyl-CoA thioesterase
MGMLDVTIGMTAEKIVTVTSHMTEVHATPIMILHMEMAAGAAIASHLPEGFVSAGMDVKLRHLAATPVGPHHLTLSPSSW